MRNRPSGVQGLVFGGLMAALVVVFALIPFLNPFMPVPLVLTYVRYGGRVAVLAGVVAAVFSSLFVGPLQAFVILVPAGIAPGLVIGYGFQRKLRPITVGLLAVAVFIGAFAAEYAVSRAVLLQGRDPFEVALESEEIRATLEKQLDTLEALYRQSASQGEGAASAAERGLAYIEEIRRNPIGMIWVMLPAALSFMGALTAWIQIVLCRWVLVRFGHEVPQPTPFSQLRLPPWLALLYAVSLVGFGYAGASLVEAPWWVQLSVNTLSLLNFVFLLAGIAVAYGFFRKRNVPKWAAALYSLLGLLLGGLGLNLYIFLALGDAIFDFRGLGHGLWKRLNET